MNLLTSIFKTREQKIQELQVKIRARDEAQRAVMLAKKLATELPETIRDQEKVAFSPHLSQMCAEEDAVPIDLVENYMGLQALRNLLQDLPDITNHWEERLRFLVGTKDKP